MNINERIKARHIELVEAVNTSATNAEHFRRDACLRAWRDGLGLGLGWSDYERGLLVMEADNHYLSQGIDRPMCGGVWLDWTPREPGC